MQHDSTDETLKAYYAHRAREYERIYDKPERQEDLARLRECVPSSFSGRDVLEVACGTGYWTQFVATRAASVLATDVNEEVLELARRKTYSRNNVSIARLDIYSQADLASSFDAGLAAFWWCITHLLNESGNVLGFAARLHADSRSLGGHCSRGGRRGLAELRRV